MESIRSFDADTQRSIKKLDSIRLLPAREYPLDDEGIKRFRLRFRETFDIDPNTCPVYVDISEGIASPGVEYYLPLFFDQLATLFDYLPDNCRMLIDDAVATHAASFIEQIHQRFESRRYKLGAATPVFFRLQIRRKNGQWLQLRFALDSPVDTAIQRRGARQGAARVYRKTGV